MKCLVTGGEGFIGGHMYNLLCREGNDVNKVDIKSGVDLRDFKACLTATKNIDWVFHLAADVGGSAYIYDPKVQTEMTRNNVSIDLNMLRASEINGVKRFLYASSSCVYPLTHPDGAYGREKLFMEKAMKIAGLETRVVRFQNVYGPGETIGGVKEKVIPALCRKIIQADKEIEIWASGKSVRDFVYVEDAVKQVYSVIQGNESPVDIGGTQISINGLAEGLIDISGKNLKIRHIHGAEGVRHKPEREHYAKPTIDLYEGLKRTYEWTKNQLR